MQRPRASDRRPRLRGKRGWVASCLSGSRVSLEQLSLPHMPVLAPGRGVGLTGIAGQRAALISGSRTQVHPRYTQDQSLGPPASTRELVPFCLLSAGTSESLGSPHTISSPSCAWYVPLPLPTPGQPLLVLLFSSGTTSSRKPSSVPSLRGHWWPSGLSNTFPSPLPHASPALEMPVFLVASGSPWCWHIVGTEL